MHKWYNGQITIQLSTIVEAQEESTKECNSAHDAIDLDFLTDLKELVKAKGYTSNFVGFDLQLAGDATMTDIEELDKTVRQAKAKEDVIRGKATVTKIYF
ncbi:hypothetical protein ACIQXI_14270 [Lysinibacillus sp. NPDC097195]|uniref:hypothetical protein n=1 Tax=Lysinibacillus sp. NPDC097195 TaxID=3364141 RepID=UPI003811C6D3